MQLRPLRLFELEGARHGLGAGSSGLAAPRHWLASENSWWRSREHGRRDDGPLCATTLGLTAPGVDREGEGKRTAVLVSKRRNSHQNRRPNIGGGMSLGDDLLAAQVVPRIDRGGASPVQALMWNVGTCGPMPWLAEGVRLGQRPTSGGIREVAGFVHSVLVRSHPPLPAFGPGRTAVRGSYGHLTRVRAPAARRARSARARAAAGEAPTSWRYRPFA